MAQLSSSMRVARAALNQRPVVSAWQNLSRRSLCQNVVVDAASASEVAQHCMAGGSARRFASVSSNYESNTAMPMGRLHSLNGTMMQNILCAQIPTLSQSDSDQTAAAEAEHINAAQAQQAPISIPLKRSKKKAKSKAEDSSNFDERAKAKLAALSDAKKEAEDAKSAFLSMVWKPTQQEESSADLHARWNAAEQNLALAYSQAIKYTSRITKNEKATQAAEKLLYEWMDRFMMEFGGSSTVWTTKDDRDTDTKSHATNALYLNKKWMVRTINAVVPKLTKDEGDSASSSSGTLPKIRIPPPASKDYINMLRAYSVSKARRKGQQCEALMRNMMRLANTVSYYYDEENSEWTEDKSHDVGMEPLTSGEETKKRWKWWVAGSVPNSKTFALAVKCNAGSTHNESFDRIILLNEIHDSYADCGQPHIPGLYRDDPYVLFHSIKALKNLQREEEMKYGRQWLDKLHGFVTNPENVDYSQYSSESRNQTHKRGSSASDDEVGGDQTNDEVLTLESFAASSETIDVTSAYTTMIRLMARLRGADGTAADGRRVLDQMHEVRHVFENGLACDETSDVEDGDANNLYQRRIASIGIRPNAYNLVLGLYRDSKNVGDAMKAVELLQRMVDAEKKESKDRGGVPMPTEQSFEFTILSLQYMSDREKSLEEAERLIQLMQNPTAATYNALINVCNNQLFGKAELYHKAVEILDKMKEMGKTNIDVLPNPETLALVMKSCALSEHEDHKKVLDTASDLFFQLKEQEPDENSAVALTDRAYFNMIKCADMHLADEPEKKAELIETLFSEACQRGLCSANVLTLFRNSVSAEDFRLTVGKGRLADHWIANIKGPRALYSDGKTGGAGKHARRKGKSTSNWVKKQNENEARRDTRRKDKKAKKFFKNMKAA